LPPLFKSLNSGYGKKKGKTHDVAIVKAHYTMKQAAAKASIRYIEHRPGNANQRIRRTLFGTDGAMSRQQAYALIDDARQGSVFFRFIISPDPKLEDTQQDLYLRGIADQTMQTLTERVGTPVSWVGAIHADHTPHRHVHVVAVVEGRLNRDDLQAVTRAATEASLEQRSERDQAQEARQQENERKAQEEEQWER
jgi:hypothetical protein